MAVLNGTDVYYNGVLLKNVQTKEWRQELSYDESNTDFLLSRFHLSFEGILHVQGPASTSPSGIYGPTSGVNKISDAYSDVRSALSTPRKQLVINVNGVTWLMVNPADGPQTDGDRDHENGPKPKNVQVLWIGGASVARVLFSIDVVKLECSTKYSTNTYARLSGKSNGPPGLVLSNRWSVSEDMDENFFTTRTISGAIRISSSQINPLHYYKYICVPGLEDGFKRDSISYQVQPDGLVAHYTVTDRQVHTAAPSPATSMSGTHTESTDNGITFMSHLQVRLDGDPSTDKKLLIQRAVQIADARLSFSKRQFNTDYTIEHAAIIDHFGASNAVEVQMQIRQNYKLSEVFLANLRVDTLGQPLTLPDLPGAESSGSSGGGGGNGGIAGGKNSNSNGSYNPKLSRVPALYGYTPTSAERDPAVLFTLHCFLQSPCSPDKDHQIGQFKPQSNSNTDQLSRYDTKVSGYRSPDKLPQSSNPRYSADTHDAVYTLARMESTYTLQPTRVQLPIADSSGGGGGTKTKSTGSSSGGSGGSGNGGIASGGSSSTPSGGSKGAASAGNSAGTDSCQVFTLGRPLARRLITYEAERIGQQPAMPEPMDNYQDGSIKGVLLSHASAIRVPTLTPDGRKKVFHVSATYEYALNRPPSESDKANVGVLPFTSYSQDDNAFVPQDSYSQNVGP